MIASEYSYSIESFLDLTMRQLTAFLEKIRIRNTSKEYYRMSFLAKLHRAENFPSLEEVLGVSLDESPTFDPKTEEMLDRHAERLLKEKQMVRNV